MYPRARRGVRSLLNTRLKLFIDEKKKILDKKQRLGARIVHAVLQNET